MNDPAVVSQISTTFDTLHLENINTAAIWSSENTLNVTKLFFTPEEEENFGFHQFKQVLLLLNCPPALDSEVSFFDPKGIVVEY